MISRNELCKNIGCLLSAPNFGLGGSRLWEKYPKISGKKRKRSYIRPKVDLYEVCASLFQILYYYYYLYINTSFPSAVFMASLTIGERSLGSIGQEALSWRDKISNMSSGG